MQSVELLLPTCVRVLRSFAHTLYRRFKTQHGVFPEELVNISSKTSAIMNREDLLLYTVLFLEYFALYIGFQLYVESLRDFFEEWRR